MNERVLGDVTGDGPQYMTLVFPYDSTGILLGMKKEGFGKGRWNGFGGKVKEGEQLKDAAVRELKEECGLEASPDDLVEAGILNFYPYYCVVFVYGYRVKGDLRQERPVETEEMIPRRFANEEIPFDQMWADDSYWLPLFLKGIPFVGEFHFNGDDSVREWSLEGMP